MITKKIKKKLKVFLVALDYYFINKFIDLKINLFNHNKNIIRRNDNVFTGLKFSIIRKSLKNHINLSDKEYKKKIMISFGGSDKKKNTLKVINWLSDSNFNNFDIYLTKTIYNNNLPSLLKFKKNNQISVLKEFSDFDKKIKKSYLIFCGGGSTLLESCYCGIPAIVIPQTQNENKFANYLEKKNSVILVKNFHTDGKKLRKFINSKKLISRMSTTQRKLIDNKGTTRINYLIFNKFRKYESKREN